MQATQYQSRAEQLLNKMKAGGICLIRLDVAYALVCTEREAVQKIFDIKQRSRERACVVLGTPEIFREITTSKYKNEAGEVKLPVALIDKISHKSRYTQSLPPEVVTDDTIAVFINMGEQADIIATHAFNKDTLVYGSSANLSGAGNHYRLQDVEDGIRRAADLEFDDGDVKYQDFWPDGRGVSSTMIDLVSRKIVRKGLLLVELTEKGKSLKLISSE